MATEISEAIKPYSIAVAPSSSLKKRTMRMTYSLVEKLVIHPNGVRMSSSYWKALKQQLIKRDIIYANQQDIRLKLFRLCRQFRKAFDGTEFCAAQTTS
jgi:hypothetical protein